MLNGENDWCMPEMVPSSPTYICLYFAEIIHQKVVKKNFTRFKIVLFWTCACFALHCCRYGYHKTTTSIVLLLLFVCIFTWHIKIFAKQVNLKQYLVSGGPMMDAFHYWNGVNTLDHVTLSVTTMVISFQGKTECLHLLIIFWTLFHVQCPH